MKKKEDTSDDPNKTGISGDAFSKYYNANIPRGFPRATPKALAEFHDRYPSLFKDEKWTISHHRKKFMDWLVSYHEE